MKAKTAFANKTTMNAKTTYEREAVKAYSLMCLKLDRLAYEIALANETREPLDRNAVKQTCVCLNLTTHVGGQHVAVMDGTKRLAMVTGNFGDWL